MTMEQTRLSGALQENLLTLLCFDDSAAKLIRAAVTPSLFESAVFREVAGIAIDFVDQFGVAVKEHLPDHLEDILKGEDPRKAKSYQMLVDNLFAAKDSINSEYVLTQLNAFVRQQRLKSAVIDAVEALEDGRVEEAEVVLQKGLTSQVISFSGGLNLSSPEDIATVLDMPEEEGFHTGIKELDERGILPRRKEVMTFMAPRGRGKSWWITHLSKMGMLQRWRGAIISLEMSERRYAVRMIQSFFAVSRRDAAVRVSRLDTVDGVLNEIRPEMIERLSMSHPDFRDKIMARAKREFRRRPGFRIKEFPSKSLDLNGLIAYLDGLERHEGFTPDFICLDYPDLMKLDANNLRIELGDFIAAFRGVCVERNAAGILVTQGNRDAERAKLVTGDMAAEDISKLAISDTFITYSQTDIERQLGLARLFVAKARNEESGMQILLSQAYGIGQFCLDSALIHQEQYWSLVGGTEQGTPDARNRARRRDRDPDEDSPPRRRRRGSE